MVVQWRLAWCGMPRIGKSGYSHTLLKCLLIISRTTEENPDEFVDKLLGFIGKHNIVVTEKGRIGESSKSALNCKAHL